MWQSAEARVMPGGRKAGDQLSPDPLRLGGFGAHWKTFRERDRNRLFVPADFGWKAAHNMNDYLPSGLREFHIQAVGTRFWCHHADSLNIVRSRLRALDPWNHATNGPVQVEDQDRATV